MLGTICCGVVRYKIETCNSLQFKHDIAEQYHAWISFIPRSLCRCKTEKSQIIAWAIYLLSLQIRWLLPQVSWLVQLYLSQNVALLVTSWNFFTFFLTFILTPCLPSITILACFNSCTYHWLSRKSGSLRTLQVCLNHLEIYHFLTTTGYYSMLFLEHFQETQVLLLHRYVYHVASSHHVRCIYIRMVKKVVKSFHRTCFHKSVSTLWLLQSTQ